MNTARTSVLVDSNVLIDIIQRDPNWYHWSSNQVQKEGKLGLLIVNPIIYAEIALCFSSLDDLDNWMDPAIFARDPLPYDAGWSASQAFLRYRRAGGTRSTPLPDFYIGAHAETAGLSLITRDVARYQTYFPSVRLIHP